jgi:hypothetical protein
MEALKTKNVMGVTAFLFAWLGTNLLPDGLIARRWE